MLSPRWWIARGILGSTPLFAESEERFRFQLGYVSSPSEIFHSGGVLLGLEDAPGARFAWEHKFSDRFGLEVGAATSDHDFALSSGSHGSRETSFRMTPLTLMGNLHFADSDRVDPFFGGGLAYVFVTDYVPLGETESVSVDPELTWTVQYGIDIALGKRELFQPLARKWNLALSVSYLPQSAGASAGPGELSLESFQFHAGATLRVP